MKRSNFDFSKHELTISKSDMGTVYQFKKPNTSDCMIRFMNILGTLTVTGDLGNWIFCREFHPKAGDNNKVSGGYWDEKLQISSVQKSHQFDSEETLKHIDQFVKDFPECYGREMNDEEKEWIDDLKNASDNEFDYTHVAYRENPEDIDYESVPMGKVRHVWLNAIYDGFDAICDRMQEKELK